MKKILSLFKAILPHVTLILSLMLITFFVIDLFNESMAFLNNSITKALVCIDGALTVIQSVLCIIGKGKQKGEEYEI